MVNVIKFTPTSITAEELELQRMLERRLILKLYCQSYPPYPISIQYYPDSGKHGMTEPSAELFSKTSEMVPNGLNIPMYES